MNKYKFIVLALIPALLSMSCSTSEKLHIYGKPGTEIYLPNRMKAAEIPSSGDLKMEFPSDSFHALLLAKQPGTDYMYPFGINFRHASHNGTKAAIGVAYPMTTVGLVAGISGVVAIAIDSESSFGSIGTAGGLGLGAIGACIGAAADCRLDQLAYQYNYAYDKNQRIPEITKVSLSREDAPKESIQQTQTTRRTKGRAAVATNPTPNTASQATTTVAAKRNRNDHAKAVSGKYRGSGLLLLGSKTDETYQDVTLIIERVDKNTVSVRVVESGEDFFEKPGVYEIDRRQDGSYILTMTKMPDVTIEIDKTGVATYRNPLVAMDGDVYTLRISASK